MERWHKTLRRESLNGKVFDSIADARAQLGSMLLAEPARTLERVTATSTSVS